MNLLQMTFSGAVLILVIAVIRAAAINRLPKKTFLILWGIVLLRLLIPYSVPSAVSVYTWVSPKTLVSGNFGSAADAVHTDYRKTTMDKVSAPFSANKIPYVIEWAPHEQTGQTDKLQQQPTSPEIAISITWIIWFVGMITIAMYFVGSYLYWRFAFQTSLPIQNAFVEQWQKTHLKTHPVLVRQSDRIAAPLSYGITHPVILMPKKTDWGNTEQLQYVLLHEYVHICRHDSVFKLIAALALCVHWFNPLVWVMYILLQRDIELACDESVVRRLGEASKKTYANMLIDMEARKSGLMPLCNNFSKNAIEERIIAIMKIKKTSVTTIMLSVILIVGITAAFATSASATSKSATSVDTEKTENSNDKITIAISKGQISFECMDELNMEEEGDETGVVNTDINMDVIEFKETSSGTVNTDALKAREGAAVDAAVIGLLKEGQKVTILSEEKGFYHIFVSGEDGLDGWVRKEYVTVQ